MNMFSSKPMSGGLSSAIIRFMRSMAIRSPSIRWMTTCWIDHVPPRIGIGRGSAKQVLARQVHHRLPELCAAGCVCFDNLAVHQGTSSFPGYVLGRARGVRHQFLPVAAGRRRPAPPSATKVRTNSPRRRAPAFCGRR